MKRIMIAFAATFAMLSLTTASAVAEPPPACNENGKQATINGKVHTCGKCSTGGNTEGTSVWFKGDLDADTAESKCKQLHVKTATKAATAQESNEEATKTSGSTSTLRR